MSKMLPFLMFQGGHAETTMSLYVSLFEDGEILDVTRWQKGDAGVELGRRAERDGQRQSGQACLRLHPSWSFFVECKSGEEQERLFAELSNGEVLMPLDGYGFSKRFGWAADRFGVSWQLDLA